MKKWGLEQGLENSPCSKSQKNCNDSSRKANPLIFVVIVVVISMALAEGVSYCHAVIDALLWVMMKSNVSFGDPRS